jgi:hypothetical protein
MRGPVLAREPGLSIAAPVPNTSAAEGLGPSADDQTNAACCRMEQNDVASLGSEMVVALMRATARLSVRASAGPTSSALRENLTQRAKSGSKYDSMSLARPHQKP